MDASKYTSGRLYKRDMLPGFLLAVFCAAVLLIMRTNSDTVILFNGIPFAYTDIFILLPSGIGGLSSGLITFSILFIVELVQRSSNPAAVYSISTYLLLVLLSAFFAYRGWFRDRLRTAAIIIIETAVLALCWLVTFTLVLPGTDAENIFSGIQFGHLFLGALPEITLSAVVIALFFRYAPDRLKSSLGSGWAYTKGRIYGIRRQQVLGSRITAISMLEAFFLCIVAIIANSISAAVEAGTPFGPAFLFSRWHLWVRMGLIIMCAAVPVSYLFNLYIMKYVVRPINEMSFLMERYFKTEERSRGRELPELNIHTGDEVERLYHSLKKMVSDMSDYIDRELEHEKRSAHMTRGFMMALAKAVDAKDRYTSGHSVRVAKYSKEIARRMGKSEKEQDDIYTLGLLHDIGKIGVPDTVINKPGRLDDEEFAQIKRHPSVGAGILENVEELPGLAIGAHWHHERYDGKGYPDGIKGRGIPEEARIIAVADAYDAMTSNRSYREIMPQEKVRAEIEKGRGQQFDPDFADIMLAMIDDDKEYKMHE